VIIEQPVVPHHAPPVVVPHQAPPVVVPHTSVNPLPTQAEVTIQVAEGARLLVDGKEVSLRATSEKFFTPELDPSRIYYYEMKATIQKDGKDLSASKRVAVRAGQQVAVDLRDVKSWTAPKPEQEEVARVTVKVPENTQLYVDGVQFPQFSGERTFNTPRLTVGQPYHYSFKAEITRDGQKVSETQNVTVQAGKDISVDFQKLPVRAASR